MIGYAMQGDWALAFSALFLGGILLAKGLESRRFRNNYERWLTYFAHRRDENRNNHPAWGEWAVITNTFSQCEGLEWFGGLILFLACGALLLLPLSQGLMAVVFIATIVLYVLQSRRISVWLNTVGHGHHYRRILSLPKYK